MKAKQDKSSQADTTSTTMPSDAAGGSVGDAQDQADSQAATMVNNVHNVSGSRQTGEPVIDRWRNTRPGATQTLANQLRLRYYRKHRDRLLTIRKKRDSERKHVPDISRGTPHRIKPMPSTAPEQLRTEDKLIILTMAQDRPRRHWYAAELAEKTGISESRCERCLARLYACKLVVAYCHDKGRRPFTYAYFGQPLPPSDG